MGNNVLKISPKLNDEIKNINYKYFSNPNFGEFYISGLGGKLEDDNKITYLINLITPIGKTDSNLVYIFNKKTGEDKLLFNHDFEKLYDVYKSFDPVYTLVFDEIKDVLRPNSIKEQGIGGGAINTAGGGAQYDTPGFAPSEFMGTKGKKGKGRVSKGITHKKPMYPNGKIIKITKEQLNRIKKFIQNENNLNKTTYPGGEFIEFDDCTKLNNNKEAQNGGCSVGAVDNVVKLKKTKNSIISNESVFGKSDNIIEFVKKDF